MKWAQLLVFGTIGLALLSLGGIWGLGVYPIFRDTVSSQGTVVDLYVEGSGDSHDAVMLPVVEFVARNGVKVRFRAGGGSGSASEYEKGTRVDVLYDPNSPGTAYIGSYSQLWQRPLFAGGIGLVLIFLSVLLFKKIGSFERALTSFGSGKK
jgi:hypothetical protein